MIYSSSHRRNQLLKLFWRHGRDGTCRIAILLQILATLRTTDGLQDGLLATLLQDGLLLDHLAYTCFNTVYLFL